jgi:hypothetical protein
MGEVREFLLLMALLACLGAALTGCGGDQATGDPEPEARPERLYPWLKGPTREFLIREGDNAVQTFGREATKAEREQADEVIQAWMKARAAQDWKKDCSYFSRQFTHNLIATDAMVVTEGKVKNCAQGLAWFGHVASGSYKNNLTGPIDSLRVGKDHSYAQYHGNDGHDWVIVLEKEAGKWWIASATPIGRSS